MVRATIRRRSSSIPQIRAALLKHGVIFFRDQDLTTAQHIAFARHFGKLEIHPATPKDQPDPEVLRIEHGPKSRGQENAWHSDVTWREEPSLGSILLAREVPECGGDTLFAGMEAAYAALSPTMRAFLGTLTARHASEHVYRGRYADRGVDDTDVSYPEAVHPLVRTHPPGRATACCRGCTTTPRGPSSRSGTVGPRTT